MEETCFIKSAQNGDEKAFETLIKNTLSLFKLFLVSKYRFQSADVEEVCQLATIKAWKNISAFRGESSFSTWFYMILNNESLTYLKKRKKITFHEVPASAQEGGEAFEDYSHLDVEQALEETALSMLEHREILTAYRQIIQDTLLELSPIHSQIIQMAIQDEKTYQDIATELNLPIGTVMSRLHAARQYAKKIILKHAKRNSIQLNYVG